MKKLLAFALSATLLLSLAACGGKDDEKDPETSDIATEESLLPEETSTPEAAAPSTPTPTPAPPGTPAPPHPQPSAERENAGWGLKSA